MFDSKVFFDHRRLTNGSRWKPVVGASGRGPRRCPTWFERPSPFTGGSLDKADGTPLDGASSRILVDQTGSGCVEPSFPAASSQRHQMSLDLPAGRKSAWEFHETNEADGG